MIDRRTMLRGMLSGASVALGLPLLEGMLTSRAWACGDGLPKRFGLFFWGNGSVPAHWTPTGTGTGAAWTLSPELAPLAPVKDVVAVVTGMSVKVPNVQPHADGAAGLLSGAPVANEALESFTAATIDQLVANAIGQDTLYRSLQTAASSTLGLSFSGPNARLPAEQDPYALFGRLFGPTFVEPGSSGIVDPKLGLRRSVLDAVMGDLARLDARVGAADRVRLEQHLDGVRELEQRLARLQEDPPDLEACARPEEPLASYPDLDGRPQISARNLAMARILAMACACDQTRVFSHWLTEPINDLLFPDATAGHHSLTHDEPGEQPQCEAITTQCVEDYAAFVQAFREVPEGGGTLLDSMALLGCSEHGHAQTHSLDEMPILIAGSACGALEQDLHYRSTTFENTGKVMLTLLRAMDVVVGEFGTGEARTTDGLDALEA